VGREHMTITTALYIIWGLVPLFFFLMALWSVLEKFSGKKKHERPGDLFKQGLFVLFCVLLSIAIEHYLLPTIADSVSFGYIPYGVFQLTLLPLVLYIAAKIIGPTKPIQITKAPSSAAYKSNKPH
jgi:hypothetical protein